MSPITAQVPTGCPSVCCLTVILACAGAAACEGAAPAASCPTDEAALQETLLRPSCGSVDGCHGETTPAAGLDLVSPGLAARLVGLEALDCPGHFLLVPGDPDRSFLLRKVADQTPACGERMPPIGDPLPEDRTDCLRRWIASLEPVDAGGVATDAGGGEQDAGPACEAGLTRCGETCVDTSSDALHCGSCDNACATDTVCFDGACTAGGCPSGTTDCGGSCVDTSTSSRHCGACGSACPDGSVCESGACACGAGLTSCSGVCVDTTSDESHCGTCGNACGSTQECDGGACVSCGPTATLTGDVQPIFNASCANLSCHSGGRPAADLSLESGRSHAELVGVTSSCRGLPLVDPGAPETSYLMNKLTGVEMCSGNRMPSRGGSLTSSQLDLIRGWICHGAAND